MSLKTLIRAFSFVLLAATIGLGQTFGEFAAPTTFSTGVAMNDFAALDLLGTTHAELFCFTPTGIQIIDRHDPTGLVTFFLPTPAQPTEVALGDIDNDGDRDVVVACTNNAFFPNLLSITSHVVLFISGPSGFTTTTLTQPSMSAVGAIHLRDVDANGSLDIVHGSGVRWNLGGATFSAPTTVTTGLQPCEAQPGDFDGDGDQDIAFIGTSSGNIQIQVMQKTGAQSFTPRPVVTTPGNRQRSVVARMNGDNRDDLVLLLSVLGKVSLRTYLGATSGSVGEQAAFEWQATYGADPMRLRVADIDDDGDSDAVIGFKTLNGGQGFQPKSVVLNTGTGTFVAQSVAGFLHTVTMSSILFDLADEDLDGQPDFIAPSASAATTTIETAQNGPPSPQTVGTIDVDENTLPYQSIALQMGAVQIVARLLLDPTTPAVGRIATVTLLTPTTGTTTAPNVIADALGNVEITVNTTNVTGALVVRIATPDGVTEDVSLAVNPTVVAVTPVLAICVGQNPTTPVIVRSVGSDGSPVPFVPIAFDLPIGPDFFATTDSNGYATLMQDFTSYPIGNYVIACGTWVGPSGSIALTVSNQFVPLPPSGSGQTTTTGQPFAQPLTVNLLGCGAGPSAFPNVTFAVTSTPATALLLSATNVTPSSAGVASINVTAAPDSFGSHTVVASIGTNPLATFTLNVRRLRTQKLATNILAVYNHEHPMVPLMFAADLPLPSPGYVASPIGNVATSILLPQPTLFVLDGLGFTGTFVPTLVTNSGGTWSRVFSSVPSLGGVTIVFQVYGYDSAYGGLDAYFISNPTMLVL